MENTTKQLLRYMAECRTYNAKVQKFIKKSLKVLESMGAKITPTTEGAIIFNRVGYIVWSNLTTRAEKDAIMDIIEEKIKYLTGQGYRFADIKIHIFVTREYKIKVWIETVHFNLTVLESGLRLECLPEFSKDKNSFILDVRKLIEEGNEETVWDGDNANTKPKNHITGKWEEIFPQNTMSRDDFNRSAESLDYARPGTFLKDLEELINKHSLENESNTPDFVLALFLRQCFDAFNEATRRRDNHQSN